MKKLKVTRYQDGGHSWFKIPRKLLTQLGIEEKISSFSYQLGENVYLEEDSDIAIFFKAYMKSDDLSWEKIQSVADVTEKYSKGRSRIRNYPSFKAGFKRAEWIEGKRVTLYGKSYTMEMINGKKILFDGNRKYSIRSSQLDEIVEIEL